MAGKKPWMIMMTRTGLEVGQVAVTSPQKARHCVALSPSPASAYLEHVYTVLAARQVSAHVHAEQCYTLARTRARACIADDATVPGLHGWMAVVVLSHAGISHFDCEQEGA